MTHAWRIDALDPQGGLAFASWRAETLFSEEPLEEVPVFYVGAPSFTPLPVANRGVALAAERRGFQLGLLDADGEVGLETLADVAEFVRRLYLATSREEGEEPGSATPLPLPHTLPPGGSAGAAAELPRPLDSGPLADAVGNFLNRSAELERGEAAPADGIWREALRFDGAGRTAWHPHLVRGGGILLVEVLERFPQLTDPDGLERWRMSAAAFASVVQRLGLFEALQGEGTVRDACLSFLHDAWAGLERAAADVPEDYAVSETLRIMARQTMHGPWAHDWDAAPAVFSSLAPLEELSRIPVPQRLAEAVSAVEPVAASVATIMSIILGAPAAIADEPDLEAVLLFGACRTVAVDGSPLIRAQHLAHETVAWDNLTFGLRDARLLQAAAAWLTANLPQVVFTPALERMLSEQETETEETDPGGGSMPQEAEVYVEEDVADGWAEQKEEQPAQVFRHAGLYWNKPDEEEVRKRQAQVIQATQTMSSSSG